MKPLLILAAILSFAGSSHAGEITFTSAPWDSLAIPLGIKAYYLTVNSPENIVKAVGFEMDLYVKGKFIRTMGQEDRCSYEQSLPLDYKCAIYFEPKSDKTYKGTLVRSRSIFNSANVNLGSQGGSSGFTLTQADFSFEHGSGIFTAIPEKVIAPGRMPLFVLYSGKDNINWPNKLDDLIKDNPNTTDSFIIGYLKTE